MSGNAPVKVVTVGPWHSGELHSMFCKVNAINSNKLFVLLEPRFQYRLFTIQPPRAPSNFDKAA